MHTKKEKSYYNDGENFKVETYEPVKQEPMQVDFLENQLVILSKQTIDKFLEYKNASDLIGLYTFYYYTAKWQKTNQPKCTLKYICKGLSWGKDKVIKTRKILEKIGLIQQIKRIDNKTGKVIGWFIKINYIWSKKKETQIPLVQKVDIPEGGLQDTNALNVNNINALNVNKEMLKKKEINESIERIYKKYPTKCPIKLTSTNKCSNNKIKIRGLLREKKEDDIIKVINDYLEESKKNKRWIKNFGTFLNQFPEPEEYDIENMSEDELIRLAKEGKI